MPPPHIYASKSSPPKGTSQKELTYQWGPEKMINVTQAGKIRRIMCCLHAPYPLAAGVQMARGVSRPQHTERCVPTLLIPEALAACLGSGQHSIPFCQDNCWWGPPPEMPPERTVEGGCWEVLLGDGRRGMEGIRTRTPQHVSSDHGLRPRSRRMNGWSQSLDFNELHPI